jgi:hypothetical protein
LAPGACASRELPLPAWFRFIRQGEGSPRLADDLARSGKNLCNERRLCHLFGRLRGKQILGGAPRAQRRLPAGRGDIGVMESDRRPEDLEASRHVRRTGEEQARSRAWRAAERKPVHASFLRALQHQP